MSYKAVFQALFGLLLPALCFADQMGPDGDKFYEEAAHYEHACQKQPCASTYSHEIVYHQKKNIRKLPSELRKALKEIAIEQAQIWGDTILEGDYVSSGLVRLDEVLAFYNGQKLIGYKIKYSEKAWYIGDCNYNGRRESLKDCQEGRVEEGSYVSADYLTFFSDEERYAQFALIKD